MPNQVYRTLARLIDQGCVQRIECLGAYVRRDGKADACLICQACHRITMIAQSTLRARIQELAKATGFAANLTMIEAHGLCADCSDKPH